MQNTQLFQKMLPVKINFYQGESPSPSKLNGIFNYIQASYYIAESYLGNGIDYEFTPGNLTSRKMMHNIAGAIGKMGDIYKPINKLGSLEHIHRCYGAVNQGNTATDGLHNAHTIYVPGTNGYLDEYLQIDEEINIPISVQVESNDSYSLIINFKGQGALTVNNGLSNSLNVCDDGIGGSAIYPTSKIITIVGGSYIDFIKITPVSNFNILSISLLSNSESHAYQTLCFNVAASMPLNQEKYWTVKSPCSRAYTQSTNELCDKATCQFCIGNTYDIYLQDGALADDARYGIPICGGDFETLLPSELIPKDNAVSTVAYTAYNPAGSVKTYSVQSSLLMTSRYFMSKYSPFAAYDPNIYGVGDPIAKNETVIYDSGALKSPILLDVVIFASGRPDIVYLSDVKNEIIAPTNTRFFVTGGSYSIAQMLRDILLYLSNQQKPMTAVYSD
jgi:hypothetical protein